jgi:ParB family chromosome partitioning protein
MQMAYESGELRGKQLRLASRILDQRTLNGKSLRLKGKQFDRKVTPAALVRTYQRETERQHTVVRKAGLTHQRLIFVVNALQALIADENFVTLLRAEGIDTMPQYLANRIGARIAPI